jgi:anti-repressor protein
MTEELQIFDNPQFGKVRTYKESDGSITFCGADSAAALGYADTAKAIKQHCKEDGVAFHPVIDSLGRTQNAKFITKGNLLRLIAGSELPGADKFESWIFDEVIPQVLETGTYSAQRDSYMIEDPIERAETWIAEKKRLITVETEVNELKPKAAYYDHILKNPGLVTITSIAKDYGMTAREMNKLLHDNGIQFKQGSQWILYKQYDSFGYVSSEPVEFKHKDGTLDVNPQTKWTQKGRKFLYDFFKGKEILPIIEQPPFKQAG